MGDVMDTYNRICIKEYEVTAENGDHFKVERGKEYTTSAVDCSCGSIGPDPVKDHVIVFSNYWVPVPVEYFAGEIKI